MLDERHTLGNLAPGFACNFLNRKAVQRFEAASRLVIKCCLSAFSLYCLEEGKGGR